MRDDMPTVAELHVEPPGPVRTGRAARLHRYATDKARETRIIRDTALNWLVNGQHMRPAEIERATGVPPSMTNYASSRARVEVPEVEDPIETVLEAKTIIEHWEGVIEVAKQIRDDGIRELLATGSWSSRDLPALVGLTPSRVSQIGGGNTRPGQAPSTRGSLRFATYDEFCRELRRRADIADARSDPATARVLRSAAVGLTGLDEDSQ